MKVYVYFRPVRPPEWWPRDSKAGHFRYVGALKDGLGWVIDEGDPISEKQVRNIKALLQEEFGAIKLKEVIAHDQPRSSSKTTKRRVEARQRKGPALRAGERRAKNDRRNDDASKSTARAGRKASARRKAD